MAIQKPMKNILFNALTYSSLKVIYSRVESTNERVFCSSLALEKGLKGQDYYLMFFLL